MNETSTSKNSYFKKSVKNFFSFKTNDKLGILIALIVLIIVASLLSPSFFNGKNLLNILKQNSMMGIATIGMTLVILAGCIDLSVGTTVAICGLIAGYLKDTSFIVIFLAVMAAGAIIGFINGFLVANRKLEPFIVTLSMQITMRGVCLFVTGGGYVSKVNTFDWVGNGYIGPIPVPALIMVVMFILFSIVMTKTVFGRNVYALGGNETAAKLSGIKTEKTKVLVYILCGILCALASLINVSRLSTAEPLAAEGLEADCIAAALVGGNSLLGGRGSVVGAFIGVLVFAILSNVFNLIGLKSAEQQIIKGIIIIAAVLMSQRRKAKKA